MKAKIRKALFAFFYYSGLTHFTAKFVLRGRKALPFIVLIYHRITEDLGKEVNGDQTINHPLSNFKKEMVFLKKCFNVVSLDKMTTYIGQKFDPKKPTVAITFDDGYEDTYTLAFPVLRRLGIPATVFLTTGFMDTFDVPPAERIERAIRLSERSKLKMNSSYLNCMYPLSTMDDKRHAFKKILDRFRKLNNVQREELTNDVIEALSPADGKNSRMLTWDEVGEMSQGNITFGAHTVNHPSLTRIPAEKAEQEIKYSKSHIESKTGRAVKHFAFPFGYKDDFDNSLIDYCRKIGFSSASTAVYGTNRLGSDVYSLKRLSPGETTPVFAGNLVRNFMRNSGGAKWQE